MRLSENAHLPFDWPFDRLTVLSKVEGLTALSKAEGLRYPHPSSLRRTQKVKGGSPSAVSSGPNGSAEPGRLALEPDLRLGNHF